MKKGETFFLIATITAAIIGFVIFFQKFMEQKMILAPADESYVSNDDE